MHRTIWLYLEGAMPPYFALCCRTIIAHNDRVRLLDRAGFDRLFQRARDSDIDRLDLSEDDLLGGRYFLSFLSRRALAGTDPDLERRPGGNGPAFDPATAGRRGLITCHAPGRDRPRDSATVSTHRCDARDLGR